MNVANLIKNWPFSKTERLPGELHLFVGMPVIVTQNIAVELGITNGTKGVVKSIHFKNGEVISGDTTGVHRLRHMPDYIIVELDDITMKPLDGLEPNHVPIFPMHSQGKFEVKVKGNRKKADKVFKVSRFHFPLVPRFSCTAHKSQGQTLTKAIVDLVPQRNRVGRIGIEFSYVPLSRVRTLNDLTILRPFDPSILKAKVNQAYQSMINEYERRDLCRNM